ncbi:hypothetical protein CXZ05_02195 [Arthrobacter sp. AFG20]|nr:hypothetical protein CXZ05_02195 [Arthrobacter sp. AFG20]
MGAPLRAELKQAIKQLLLKQFVHESSRNLQDQSHVFHASLLQALDCIAPGQIGLLLKLTVPPQSREEEQCRPKTLFDLQLD